MYRIVTLVLFMLSQPASSVSLLVDDNFAGYAATGLSPDGVGGTLDSTLWTVTGASDGDTVFGDTRSSGDFARGASTGGVRTGGLYAFLLPGGQPGLGVQATGSDFTPGRITRRVVNDTGAALNNLALALDLWYLNNGSRSSRVSAAYATSELTPWSPLSGLQLDTPAAADALGWQPWSVFTPLPLELLDTGEALFLSWHFDDLGGTGSRDEIALSGLRLSGSTTAPRSLASPGSRTLGLVGLVLAGLFHLATRRGARPRAATDELTSATRSPFTSTHEETAAGPT